MTTIRTMTNPELLFHYSAGRWLWNEPEQLSRRYRKFNIAELLKAGASAVNSASCIGVEKLPEGNFNKALLLRMNDGKELVAKIPNPNAGRPHFTIASEVATMDFARNVMGMPVPRVLHWCSRSSRSPVGAEYILMEKIPGRPLSEFWNDMHGKDKATIVSRIVNIDTKFASTHFPMYGSLYYANDTTPTPGSEVLQDKVSQSFVVGPTTGRSSFDDMRAEINADQGPWHTAGEYFSAIAEREKKCIEHFSTFPRQQGIYNAPGLYHPSSARKLSVLSKVQTVIPLLLNTERLNVSSVMWHPDLHNDNIFVDPDEPTRITGIIDWQAVNLSPLFVQARRPSLLEVDGPVLEGLSKPELPKDFDQLSDDEQLTAKKLRIAQTLLKIYEVGLAKDMPSAYRALTDRSTIRNQILGLVGSIFDDGEPILEGMLVSLCDHWDAIRAESSTDENCMQCPLAFSAKDRLRQADEQVKWESSVELMGDVIDKLGVYRGWDGRVSLDEYDGMLKKMMYIRESFLEQYAVSDEERKAWAAAWPFGNF